MIVANSGIITSSLHHHYIITLSQGWLPVVAAKQAYFHAIAQHRLGCVAQANKNYGEAVSRMKVGLVTMATDIAVM